MRFGIAENRGAGGLVDQARPDPSRYVLPEPRSVARHAFSGSPTASFGTSSKPLTLRQFSRSGTVLAETVKID